MSTGIPAGHETFEPSWSEIPLVGTVSCVLHVITGLVLGVAIAILRWNDPILLLTIPAVLVLTTVLHESVHAGVGLLIGCQVSIHLNREKWYPYVVNGDKYKTRREKLASALAPLIVLDCIALYCIVNNDFTNLSRLLAVVVFAVNTLGAGGGAGSDIETAIQTWHLPSGTRVRDMPNEPSMFIRPRTSQKE